MSIQMKTAVAVVAVSAASSAFADGHLSEVSFGTNWAPRPNTEATISRLPMALMKPAG